MVQIKCRKCGRNAEASQFVLDSIERMMICPNCVKDKKAKKIASDVRRETQREEKKEKEQEEKFDDSLEIIKKPEECAIMVTRLDEERVKYKCPKCGYSFAYNTSTGRPHNCGYCGMGVGKIKIKDLSYDLDLM